MDVESSRDGQDQGALAQLGDRRPALVADGKAILTAMHHDQVDGHRTSSVRWAWITPGRNSSFTYPATTKPLRAIEREKLGCRRVGDDVESGRLRVPESGADGG